MAYIGKQPIVGNFLKLDAIVTSATATYNLLNGGTAYYPQTANNCIVSLNGVIQSPTSAYTISGSTIVFSDALTSSDSIDFILVLGDVLAIGTPSDGTITSAKLASGTTGLIAWQSVQTTGFTASAGRGYPCNTTSAAFTVTLPASPSAGDEIIIVDYAGTFATNNLNITSTAKINGSDNDVKLTTDREGTRLVYIDSTQGWLAYSGVNEGTAPSLTDNPPTYSIDFLVVAGGGGGGYGIYHSGGGGAGGYRTSTQTVTIGNTITVTVGGGGAGGTVNDGANGSNSSISGSGLTTITSAGGGGGSNNASPAEGNNGGSGGGAGYGGSAGGLGNTPSTSPSQGNNGGSSSASAVNYGCGGGGGAGAVGGNGTSTTGGNGGAGTASSITGSSVTRAGGGGGSTYNGGTPGSGGAGGGGAGSTGQGVAGTANTGGGGGASERTGGNNPGGAGGSGVVILSVPTASYSSTTTGSPTVTTSGSNTIMVFNGSGSYTA
jgi:hypothetical protein